MFQSCPGPGPGPGGYLPTIIRTRIRTRIHIRARGFLDYKFLDIAVIFRRQFLDSIVIFRRLGIFIFSLPIGIFGAQTAIFRLQQHKFSIKK